MDRLPIELLYEIVVKLSTDHDALTALRATNRKYREVVFHGWLKPMLVANIGELLPEAMALHKLPYLSKRERSQVRDWFLRWFRYRALSTMDERDFHYVKPRITIPKASEVDDVALSRLSVREFFHLVDFHQSWVMKQAKPLSRYIKIARLSPRAAAQELSSQRCPSTRRPALQRQRHTEQSTTFEPWRVLLSLTSTHGTSKIALGSTCMAFECISRRYSWTSNRCRSAASGDSQVISCSVHPTSFAKPPIGSGNGGNWPCNLLMSDSRVLIYSTP